MTISTNDQQVDVEKYGANFDKIFGKTDRLKSGSYVQDLKTGKLIPCEIRKTRPRVNAPSVMKPLEPFMSPIDQQMIVSRRQLAAHNTKHGVTDMRDYGTDYISKKATQRISDGERHLKKTRIEDIKYAMDKHS